MTLNPLTDLLKIQIELDRAQRTVAEALDARRKILCGLIDDRTIPAELIVDALQGTGVDRLIRILDDCGYVTPPPAVKQTTEETDRKRRRTDGPRKVATDRAFPPDWRSIES